MGSAGCCSGAPGEEPAVTDSHCAYGVRWARLGTWGGNRGAMGQAVPQLTFNGTATCVQLGSACAYGLPVSP